MENGASFCAFTRTAIGPSRASPPANPTSLRICIDKSLLVCPHNCGSVRSVSLARRKVNHIDLVEARTVHFRRRALWVGYRLRPRVQDRSSSMQYRMLGDDGIKVSAVGFGV